MKKFTNLIIFIVGITSSLALPKPKKRDNQATEMSEECRQILWEKEDECFKFAVDEEFINSMEESCKLIEDKCKTFFEGDYSKIPGCESVTEVPFIKEKKLKYKKARYEYVCAKSESDKFCLSNVMSVNANTTVGEYIELLKEYANETCKSKKCVDSVNNYMDAQDDYFEVSSKDKREFEFAGGEETIEDYKSEVVKYFKSEDCLSKHSTGTISDNNLNSNGSENIKYFSFHNIICSLMLIFTWWIYNMY
ncbi:hypothetical protein BCR32DRAFT_250337 [Anaeromyces robustus]|uniref:Uncharacterized protein n=1 Tax=Anaeromyces robustus TaxID=1754192 RepID=A0A1Y1W4L8_9FUNG|nr:hypothetical protein BCR32DRAFT_250337 [Anaeromyces robustus]|eukprot:ORX68437.1 hypothetical protein BCR32DRAFT_250337 [Anaeromyces robustus]